MTRKIDRIIVGCYKGDLWWTRMCVASIRYWYPERPISLLKDEGQGPFDTQEIEAAFQVGIVDAGRPVRYRSPVAKSEVFYLENQRTLYLDSDIVMAGPVLDLLEQHGGDFLIPPNLTPLREDDEHVRELYYEINRIHEFDPAFRYPGYVFNAGQFVATGGILQRSEIERFFNPPGKTKPHFQAALKLNDQGVLNYLLPKLVQEGRATVGLVDFKLFAHPWVLSEERVPMVDQLNRTSQPTVIHYAGEKFPLNSQCLRPDILNFYEELYYAHIRNGWLLRPLRAAKRYVDWFPGYAYRRLRMILRKYLPTR